MKKTVDDLTPLEADLALALALGLRYIAVAERPTCGQEQLGTCWVVPSVGRAFVVVWRADRTGVFTPFTSAPRYAPAWAEEMVWAMRQFIRITLGDSVDLPDDVAGAIAC